MGFTNDYKRKLNILIPYYRNKYLKETKDGKWQQIMFYMNDETKLPICSSKLYCGLEKQSMLVRDDIYNFAVTKLQKKAVENTEWNQIINDTAYKLSALMDFRKEEESIYVLKSACRKLRPCKNILYYGEVLWLFEILCAYFIARNNMISEKDFYHLDAVTVVFENELKQLAMYYLFVYANHHEDEKIAYILDKYDYHASKLLPNQLFAMTEDLRNGKMLRVLDTGKELEAVFLKTKNWIQLYYLYTKLLSIYINLDFEMAEVYIKKMKYMLAENEELTLNQKYNGYMNLGTILLYAGKYEKSIECLKEAIKLSDLKLVRCAICICHAYRMLNRSIPSEYLEIDDITKGDTVDWIVYAFFHNFKVGDSENQKKYIIKNVLPFLEINDKLYLKIVEEELEVLCENGKGYKAVYDFYAYIRKKTKENQR